MKAALVTPATESIEIIEVGPDYESWKKVIGADGADHETLCQAPDLMAIVHDDGMTQGLPSFTIYAPARHARIDLYGPTLIVASDESQLIDVTSDDIKRLDIIF